MTRRDGPRRSREESHLLNAAFCAVLSLRVAEGYSAEAARGMPFAILFIAMPILLHSATREALPRNTRTSLASWLESNAALRAGLADRARALVPFVREGILFGALHGALQLSGQGLVIPGRVVEPPEALTASATANAKSCLERARFVGRWLARAGSPETVMTLWGVRP